MYWDSDLDTSEASDESMVEDLENDQNAQEARPRHARFPVKTMLLKENLLTDFQFASLKKHLF